MILTAAPPRNNRNAANRPRDSNEPAGAAASRSPSAMLAGLTGDRLPPVEVASERIGRLNRIIST